MLSYDLNIFRTIISVTDCVLLQTDIESIRGWCAVSFIKLNSDKTRVITL